MMSDPAKQAQLMCTPGLLPKLGTAAQQLVMRCSSCAVMKEAHVGLRECQVGAQLATSS